MSEFLVLAVLWWGGRFEKDTVQSCSGVAVKPVSPCMLTICKSALREMSLKGHWGKWSHVSGTVLKVLSDHCCVTGCCLEMPEQLSVWAERYLLFDSVWRRKKNSAWGPKLFFGKVTRIFLRSKSAVITQEGCQMDNVRKSYSHLVKKHLHSN